MVYLFSGKVGKGKTKALQKWIKTQKGIDGFLSPKIKGKRFFKNIKTKILIPLETENSNLKVGRFHFDNESFKLVEYELYKLWNSDISTLVIDEIGPLEIKKNKGFHNLILDILNSKKDSDKNLILVIRDYLLDAFIEKYPFSDYKIISANNSDFSIQNMPIGLVLAGGKSKRMQTDKAFLKYHKLPQWQYVHDLLKPFCKEVYLSFNQLQAKEFTNKNYKIIEDLATYKNHGPMTALLSFITQFPDSPVFLVACDFPYLQKKDLFQIVHNRNKNNEITCFLKDKYPEPLISIFEPISYPKILSFFNNGNDSISKFIQSSKVNLVKLEDDTCLTNVNHKADFDKLIKKQIL